MMALPLVARGDEAPPAQGQVARPVEDAVAQSLFDEGVAHMQRGEFEEACRKLDESLRLSPGGGTALNLAICLEKIGKLASAYVAYNQALSAARRDGRKERITIARDRLAAIHPLLPKLVISVPAASHVPGLAIKLDGVQLGDAAWGSPVPVDPGPHRLEASGPGRRGWTTTVEVAGIGPTEIQIPPLPLAPGGPPAKSDLPASPLPSGRGATQRKVAYVFAGIGAGFLLEGAITGALFLSRSSAYRSACPTSRGCSAEAIGAYDDSVAFGTASAVGFIGMMATVGAAIVLYVTAPKGEIQRATRAPLGAVLF